MGGYGSGKRSGFKNKTTTDEVNRIDIRFMRKQGFLKPYTSGVLQWTCRGVTRGSILFSSFEDHLRLSYRFKDKGDWQSVEQRIDYDKTPCHFGGDRFWFCCPSCNKRVALLYGQGSEFLCRLCCQLGYASQQEARRDNLINQKHKLGERIFEHYENGNGWGKKKGMHWQTFTRLHDRYQYLEQQWIKHLAKHLHLF